MSPGKTVAVNERVACGPGRPLMWILGPCVIESHDLTLRIADTLAELAGRMKLPVVFKASFDKANRTSGKSFRGPGLAEGLEDARRGQGATGLAGDDRHPRDAARSGRSPRCATCCRSRRSSPGRPTWSLAAGQTGRAVNVKKGQFMAPWDMKNVVAKMREVGNDRLLLTERGSTFGYNTLVADMRSIPWMQDLGCPVIFDATHSVQMPGGAGDKSERRPPHDPVPGAGRRGRRLRRRVHGDAPRAGQGAERRAEHDRSGGPAGAARGPPGVRQAVAPAGTT